MDPEKLLKQMALSSSWRSRTRRSSSPREAIGLQLAHVTEVYGLDAIAVADDLGRCLAYAGDRNVSKLLADATMWAVDGVDEFTMNEVRGHYPDLSPDQVVSQRLEVSGLERVIAVGTSPYRVVAVERACEGIVRICARTSIDGAVDFDQTSRVDELGHGVRWRIFTH